MFYQLEPYLSMVIWLLTVRKTQEFSDGFSFPIGLYQYEHIYFSNFFPLPSFPSLLFPSLSLSLSSVVLGLRPRAYTF